MYTTCILLMFSIMYTPYMHIHGWLYMHYVIEGNGRRYMYVCTSTSCILLCDRNIIMLECLCVLVCHSVDV